MSLNGPEWITLDQGMHKNCHQFSPNGYRPLGWMAVVVFWVGEELVFGPYATQHEAHGVAWNHAYGPPRPHRGSVKSIGTRPEEASK